MDFPRNAYPCNHCNVDESDTQVHAFDGLAKDGKVNHTLDGKQLSLPQRGLNIIRLGNGIVKKVMVK